MIIVQACFMIILYKCVIIMLYGWTIDGMPGADRSKLSNQFRFSNGEWLCSMHHGLVLTVTIRNSGLYIFLNIGNTSKVAFLGLEEAQNDGLDEGGDAAVEVDESDAVAAVEAEHGEVLGAAAGAARVVVVVDEEERVRAALQVRHRQQPPFQPEGGRGIQISETQDICFALLTG